VAEIEGSGTDLEDVIKRFETDYAAQKAAEERAKAEAAAKAAAEPPPAEAPAAEAQPEAAASEPAAAPQTYVVQAGDSLSAISEKIYGDAKHWTTIFEHNKDKISDPDVIHPGQELVIP
jgi:nucleoid-associated protein YgaU